MNEPLLPIPDAGRFLGYTGKSSGKTTIHKHCNEGRLTKVKIGGRSFVTRASAENLIQRSTVNASDEAAPLTPEVAGLAIVVSP